MSKKTYYISEVNSLTDCDILQYKKCYIGVSMDNPIFWGNRRLVQLLNWVNTRFDEVLIIIGDYLFRHNYDFVDNKDVNSNDLFIDDKGIKMYNRINKMVSEIEQNTKFKIVYWREYYDMPKSKKNIQLVLDYYDTDPVFKESVNETINNFIARQTGEKMFSVEEIEKLKHGSKMYILEEIGVFSTVVDEGYIVHVYPGTHLFVIKELVNNKIPNIEIPLKQGIFIDLKML